MAAQEEHTEMERLLLMAAFVGGSVPDADFRSTARIVWKTMEWLGQEYRWVDFEEDYTPEQLEVYEALIRMTDAPGRVPERPGPASFEGIGNWGEAGNPDKPPCAPTYNACRLTPHGAAVAEKFVAARPETAARLAPIREAFAGLIGKTLVGYETAELLHADGTWGAWSDLPIRLRTEDGGLVAVSWSKFDTLWLAHDLSLPFDIGDATIRWVPNGIAALNAVLGQPIRSVSLGRGSMTWDHREVEVWTRLLIEVGDGFLEAFNALDENGYAWHGERPKGPFLPCVETCV
ncbi:MAG: hypothetical protein K2W96_16655 [Gemmataceae bacterium]|nr:hypothetical protein [Gemmataceae bacterium]